ncbi:bromodomain and WD repeat-containing protein 3 isoform X1 [Glossina fuscipes]|uniref:Bromodomain and WD repeat-containing protein 3 isoform X1 n=1 Tax=Glossina fuscipes TaxID=7396 RepID=A0A9C5Z9K7_9MUSC|nr:bromodomain and WD repeat-containing protein 3 isoform X1 [Glossina fuscipes]
MDGKYQLSESVVTSELYFLICKFLAAGPLQKTAEVLIRELEEKKVLPKRTDWLGNEYDQTLAELERKYSHIDSNHLLQICCRIGPILDKELAPSVPGLMSLLGSGRQSLLRTKESIFRSRSLLDYCTRLHGVSLPDSTVTKPVHNIQKVLIGREYGGPVRRKLLVPTGLYSKTKLLRRTVGHLSSVYCVLFDRTGRYIITGADDLLIKIWSAVDGRLLATLRGASAEITDIAINLDNTMLAAGSLDRILRVWDLQTTSPIAVLSAHTGMITSVNFCPSPRADLKYLVTTSTDGSIAFWQYSTPRGQKITFAPKPIQYHEKLRPGQAQMMCTSFSPGGMFLAAGSADHHVRVYLMSEDGPKRILETEAYTDAVDSVQWSHRGLRFISGSKDGTAHIWTFESQQWKSVKLCMTERLSSCPELEEGKKLKVTMVAWDCSDKYVITAVNDFTIKIWNSKTAQLHCVLRGHKDELFVLESNPKDEYVLLSAGHDGQVFLWDIEKGDSVAHFVNNIDGQGHGGVFDAKWSPDGTMIAATDSHGHILIFGLGIGLDKYKILPTELFFHTDYRPLLRDASHHVVDEQTQIMPHLMPPPFLVDSDGNPHPARFQKYVPGRENCSTDQLIPNLTVGADGVVVDDNVGPGGGNYSHIDRLIAALANRQGNATASGAAQNQSAIPPPAAESHSQLDRMIEALANRQGYDQAPDSNNRPSGSRSSLTGNILGNGQRILPSDRRSSDTSNGQPRQGTTWGRPPEQQLPTSQFKYVRRVYVRPMRYPQLQHLKQTVYAAGQYEMQEYKREMRRRPIMISTASVVASQSGVGRPRNTRSNGAGRVGRRRGGRPPGGQAQQQQSQPAYRTRAMRDQEENAQPAPPPVDLEEDEESSGSSGDTSYSNVEENLEESSEDSDTESSDYSDWVADTPGPNLEPPKRSKRKPLSRRRTVTDDSSDETTEQATTSAKAGRRNKRVLIPPPAPNGEIPELYRPAEWLSEVIPRKTPYYPQMGDEVVYFRQGHHRYLEAVRLKKLYKVSHSSEPWNFRTLRDREMVRVIGIKYEIRPPRLCCLKLAMIDEDGNMTGPTFKIKYHDMPDVLDFLVLRQTFDLAVQRNWNLGDRFRCMIGDGWWIGQIESRHALSSDFPDSYFMCFRVRWDNGEYEYMSPWDMEPIDENRLPDEVGGASTVLPEEIRATLYQPKSEEWHRGDRDGSCRRIINGLEQVMRLSIAEPFLAPVDLNIYPDYAYLIEYPIDLTTIKSRFENHFYRRITSAQFDVRYLATNAEKYNRRHTNIVKHARIVTDLCLRIIRREPNDIDVAAVYHQLADVYHSSESENDNESDVGPSTSTPSTTAAAGTPTARVRGSMSTTARRTSNRMRSDGDWRADCRQLLEMMWQRPDSLPFREPVDTIEFPDYLEIVATPMDLRTVKEDLLGGNYADPLDFAKDVRLIFQNSKNYNTNKRSRIYSMTLRLSALFESHIKTVVSNWKAARRRASKNKSRGANNGRGSSSSPNKRIPNDRTRSSGRRGQAPKNTRRVVRSSAEESSHNEEDDQPRGSMRRGRTAPPRGSGGVASTSSSNRVTSSSTHRRFNAGDNDQPGTSRSSRRKNALTELPDNDDDDDDEDITGSSTTEEDDDDVEDDDEPSSNEESVTDNSLSEDSEESYIPQKERKKRGRKRRHKSARKNKQGTKPKRRRIEDDSDEDFNVETRGKRKKSSKRSGGADVVRNASRKGAGTGGLSQADESTQDTVTHITPKKKGRPPKASRNNENGPSTSASALLIQSPSRTTRNQASCAALASGNGRRAAENDHSYHLPMRNGRIAESDTDSREVAVRPTRASVKRAILEWARGSDIDDDDGTEEAEEILPTPTPTKANGPTAASRDVNSSTGSRTATSATRQLRTNRNTVVESAHNESDDEDDDSDNEPLATSQASQYKSQGNSKSGNGPHPTHLHRRDVQMAQNGRLPTAPVLHMTRSHATSTTTNVASSSSIVAAPLAAHDHNYLGDPGPSTSSAAMRNSRRVLSRHQRNADELDSSLDPLEGSIISRLMRRTPTSTTNTANAAPVTTINRSRVDTPISGIPLRRGRSRYSQENSQTEPSADENLPDIEEEDDEDDVGASDIGIDGGSSDAINNSESTDSEDDQPLTSYVPASKRNGGRRPVQKKRRNSDHSFVYDDDGSDEYRGRRKRTHKGRKRKEIGEIGIRRNQRGSRNQKRPRYNELSDDEELQSKKTALAYTTTGNRIDGDDPSASTIDTDDDQLVSVSSRGRIRKITAKARGIFKE